MINLTIALDVMGGDQGPHVTLPAAILAVANLPHLHLLLCGDESVIVEALEKAQIYPHPRITISVSYTHLTLPTKRIV